MNKIMMTAAAALMALGTAASAQMDTANANAVEYMLRSYDISYNGNLADLTAEQKAALAAVDTSSDQSELQIQSQIISALGDNAMVSQDETQRGSMDMRETVLGFSAPDSDGLGSIDQLLLNRYGFGDVDYETLTAEQKAALAAVSVNDMESDSQIKSQIEAALNS